MEVLLIIGKILFGALFMGAGFNHFKNMTAMVGYAQYKNLPFAKTGVFLSGLLLIIAPILFLFSILEIVSLSGLGIFLAVTAILFHNYWTVEDPQTKMNEQISFNKNVALLGAILVMITLL